jgi:hypothetical protein
MKLRVLKKRLRRASRARARRLIPDPGRHDWAMAGVRFKRNLRDFVERMSVSCCSMLLVEPDENAQPLYRATEVLTA